MSKKFVVKAFVTVSDYINYEIEVEAENEEQAYALVQQAFNEHGGTPPSEWGEGDMNEGGYGELEFEEACEVDEYDTEEDESEEEA